MDFKQFLHQNKLTFSFVPAPTPNLLKFLHHRLEAKPPRGGGPVFLIASLPFPQWAVRAIVAATGETCSFQNAS